MDRLVTLNDGRDIAFREWGDLHGEPVLFFHGFPGSRFQARLADREAAQSGIRLIAMERPGCGLSSKISRRSLKTRSVLQWSNDVSEFAQLMSLDRYHVFGVSGGGPYALACAVNPDSRLKKVLVVCSVGPFYENRIRVRMRPREKRVLWIASQSPALFKWIYRYLIWSFSINPQSFLEKMIASMTEADRTIFRDPDNKKAVLQTFRAAHSMGTNGVAEDFLRLLKPWGFSLGEVQHPVEFWHGDADQLIPFEMSQVLAQQIKNSKVRIFQGEGHYSLPVGHAREILSFFRPKSEMRMPKIHSDESYRTID